MQKSSRADPIRKIIVVSAPGKRFSEDEKVTDLLIKLAEAALEGKNRTYELEEVVNRYRLIATGLGLSEDIVKSSKLICENVFLRTEMTNLY